MSDQRREDSQSESPSLGALVAMWPSVDIDHWFQTEVIPLVPVLTRYLGRNSKNSSEVEDLRQEVLMRAYEVGARQQPEFTKAFLFQIARNLLIDRSRRSAVRTAEVAAEFHELIAPTDFVSPEHEVGVRQEFELFRTAFDSLSTRIQEVILLRRLEGLSQRATAKRMGVSEKAVEKYLSAGLRYLAVALRGTSILTGRYRGVTLPSPPTLRRKGTAKFPSKAAA